MAFSALTFSGGLDFPRKSNPPMRKNPPNNLEENSVKGPRRKCQVENLAKAPRQNHQVDLRVKGPRRKCQAENLAKATRENHQVGPRVMGPRPQVPAKNKDLHSHQHPLPANNEAPTPVLHLLSWFFHFCLHRVCLRHRGTLREHLISRLWSLQVVVARHPQLPLWPFLVFLQAIPPWPLLWFQLPPPHQGRRVFSKSPRHQMEKLCRQIHVAVLLLFSVLVLSAWVYPSVFF